MKLLVAAGVALAIVAGAVVAARYLRASRLDRWFPARSGDVIVLEKVERPMGRDQKFVLRVRLDVPEASPADAALVPANIPGRDQLLAPRTFELEAPVDRDKWDAAGVGMRLRATYQMNLRRSDAFIATLYLDALAAPQSGK